MIHRIKTVSCGSPVKPTGPARFNRTVRQILHQTSPRCNTCIIFQSQKPQPIFEGLISTALTTNGEFLNYQVSKWKILQKEVYILCNKTII